MIEAVPTRTITADVAIVGGGPAGLSAAVALRRRGVANVVLLEREGEVGGVPRHCGHPPFGLREFGRLLTGPSYARRLGELAKAHAVDIRTRHSVVEMKPGGQLVVATPDGPCIVSATRVILATGARETPRSARLVSGERPLGVINTGALQAYIYLHKLKPFSRPVVIGTELVGLSALWTCIRHGIKPMAVVEEHPRSVARWPLGLFPRLLGIPVHYGARLVDIEGSPRVSDVTIQTRSGGSVKLACDGVLLTGHFVPEASLMRRGAVGVDDGSGGPAVDQFGRCSDPAYFAAGNLLRPIETAGWCFREGRRIGDLVADDLRGRIAPAAREVAILRGKGVKLTVPQRLAFPDPGGPRGSLQIRASEAISGRLVIRGVGRILWSRSIRTQVERRILVPLGAIAIPPDCDTIHIDIEPGS